MRLPNSFGSVYKLKGTLRRPWVARKTVGWKENGQPKYAYIGYYETRKDAMDALAKYNAKPYDTKTTFDVAFKNWCLEAKESLSDKTYRDYVSAYNRHLKALQSMKVRDIKLADMQAVMDGVTKPTGSVLRKIMSGVLHYCVRNELITTDKAELTKYLKYSSDEGNTVTRRVFTMEEIRSNKDPLITILLYTGLRIGELLALEKKDIHTKERYIDITRAKTEAGIRKVPIAERIVPLLSALPTDRTYSSIWQELKKIDHTPHDTRHTFISMMASLDPPVDERITKAIVGHAGSGITETVYTHIDLAPMLEAVNRLP